MDMNLFNIPLFYLDIFLKSQKYDHVFDVGYSYLLVSGLESCFL